MQIDLEEVPQMTIEEFADANQLVMEVKERPLPVCDKMRYYAGFKNAEVMESGCLVGAHGDGATPEEAIEDYAAEISMKRIAVDAWKPARHDITVPRLVKKKDGAFPERLPGDHFMTRAEVERLTKERDHAREALQDEVRLRVELQKRAEAAERKLAKARKAIPELDLITEYIREDDCGCYEEHICGKPIALRALAALRAALGEGGGK